jgi:hypothetical protein
LIGLAFKSLTTTPTDFTPFLPMETPMSKPASSIEWVVAESDADWQRLCESSSAHSPSGVAVSPKRNDAQPVLAIGALLLLLLVSAGAWLWRTTQVASHQHEAEVRTLAAQQLPGVAQRDGRAAISSTGDPIRLGWRHPFAREYNGLLAATQAAEPGAPLEITLNNIALHNIEVQDDGAGAPVTEQAVAEVIYAPNGGPAHRQTRFYQRTATGWQTVTPDANLLGLLRRLETPSFVFHFRQRDVAAIVSVAPQVEALYHTMRRNLGLENEPDAQKLVIHVSVTQPPRHTSQSFAASGQIIAASPALYRAPARLADAKLLAQSLALPLVEYMLAQPTSAIRFQ